MKKLFIIAFTFVLSFSITSDIHAKEKKKDNNDKNAELLVYERFIDLDNYKHLSNASIWKYDNDYANVILNSLNREEPITTIVIDY